MQRKLLLIASAFFFTVAFAANGAAQWVQTNGPYGARISCFAKSGDTLYAGTDSHGVFRSFDNGTSWHYLPRGSADPNVYAVEANGTTIVVSGYEGVWVSVDDGRSWVLKDFADVYS